MCIGPMKPPKPAPIPPPPPPPPAPEPKPKTAAETQGGVKLVSDGKVGKGRKTLRTRSAGAGLSAGTDGGSSSSPTLV